MRKLYEIPDDFEASIRILPFEEGGRASPPFNGIRWDLCYAGDSATQSLWMVWPDFIDDQGNSFPIDEPLPIGVDLNARMTVVADEMRESVHRQRLAIGSTFYCHEGSKQVAVGKVTKITGLFNERRRKT